MFESVSRQEIYRYLGYRGNQPDAAVCALVEDCLAEVDRAAVPRQVSARVPVRAEGDTVLLGELPVESRALAKHLRDCPEAFLFAATLGPGVTSCFAATAGCRSAGPLSSRRYRRL